MFKAVKFQIGPGRRNRTGDMISLANSFYHARGEAEVLIFADSRGFFLENAEWSWSMRFLRYLTHRKKAAILIVRPRDCTVFLTLLNFLRLNKIKMKYLVAQLGLVDFTPKKWDNIEDILTQKNVFFRKNNFNEEEFSRYHLSNGRHEQLYSIRFNTLAFRTCVSRVVSQNFEKAFFIANTEINSKVCFPRPRPKEFFKQLKETNRFLRQLCRDQRQFFYLNPFQGTTFNPLSVTYDGVHYTDRAHCRAEKYVREIFTQKVERSL